MLMLYQSSYAFTAYRIISKEVACNSSAASLPLRFMLQDLNDELQMLASALTTRLSSTKQDSSSFSLKSFLEKPMLDELDTAANSSQMTGRDLAESPIFCTSRQLRQQRYCSPLKSAENCYPQGCCDSVEELSSVEGGLKHYRGCVRRPKSVLFVRDRALQAVCNLVKSLQPPTSLHLLAHCCLATGNADWHCFLRQIHLTPSCFVLWFCLLINLGTRSNCAAVDLEEAVPSLRLQLSNMAAARHEC